MDGDQPGLMMFIAEASNAWARHWRSLPRDGVVPLRSVFDPLNVPALIPHMMICDLSEPDVVRIRLMGTGMVSSFGFDPTGRDYLDLVAPERRAAALEGFTVPAGHPCGMRVLGENRFENGKVMAVETVAFPFRRDDGAGMHLVFVGSNIDTTLGPWPDLGRTTTFHVFERQFIDIGAGIPDAGS
ncbi:hypothetical protein BAL199_18601 [alpha proteobacterium BAL199]|jgi:hypothetical protein|nr:hypothetical protein BAL199_18601 [alpha proteobacterium BAL199]